jgi:formamidopyrimidine-DNA glycosylase
MPELPEVELVARCLRPALLGRRIVRVTTTRPSYFFLTPPATLRRHLPGETLTTLDRAGKYLLVGLSSGARLLLHLGMTGQLILEGATNRRLTLREQRQPTASGANPRFASDRHTHLTIEFSDRGSALYFRDTRKFGKVRLLAPEQSDPRLDKLGPDALGITARILFSASRKRRIKIKSLLLDQSVTAGIGNIYADEALFLAKIHPERPASRLDQRDCATLARSVRRVLLHSIAAGGSSIDDYLHPDGSDGAFQRRLSVYGREGQACRKCRTAIERVVIGQRSSHFCPSCQR